jgi:2-oxoglutarate dehydrogenase E2 component (dihydrolipoamide succinyltransferase)
MAVEVRVPTLGESVVEATVATWLKQEGDAVEAGEPLVELETEKVNVDVAAERAGVLERIERQAGETVRPGEVLAVLADAGAGVPTAPRAASSAEDQARPVAAEAPTQPAGAAAVPGPAAPPGADSQAPPVERPHASPLARRLAEEHGVDLGRVEGTGTGGRVTREDVERHVGTGAQGLGAGGQGPGDGPAKAAPPRHPAERPVPPSPGPRPEERVRMTRRRQTIAQRLLEAQRTAAMLTTFNDVDMTAVRELRARRRDAFKERHGVSLGFMSFFTRAVVGALKAFPHLNAEIQGDEIVVKRYYDIGVAVDVGEGLVVPVIRDADRKSFAEIERQIAEFAERARNNTLTLEDLRGGTFTITNGGVFGSLLSTPILSPPQVGILGMHRIEERPVARDGEVVIRPMMYLALTYDHRIVDGRLAVQFLARIKELIEDPEALLLEG